MTRTDIAMFGSPEEQAARFRELRLQADNPESRWFLLIKELRAEHGFGILEAECMALRDPALRRWVEIQINSQPRCRRLAVAHIRLNGEDLIIEREGDAFKIRDPNP